MGARALALLLLTGCNAVFGVDVPAHDGGSGSEGDAGAPCVQPLSSFDDFDDLIGAWFPLTNALNSLNRSMGLADLYPFVLSTPAIAKLRFVHEIVENASVSGRSCANGDDVVAKSA